jgi:hypothetical protein
LTESLPSNDASDASALPRYRLEVEAGVTVLRDGWTAAFYLPSTCDRHQEAAARCIAEYLRLVGQPSLRWTIDEEGEAVELDDAAIKARLTALARPGEESVGFRLMDNPEGVSAHRVRYIGLHADDPVAAMRPDAVSLLTLTYATETVERLGLDLLARFHDAVAATLPVSSGYVSPAFVAATGAGEPPAFEKIHALCRRYRCLDVSHVSIDALTLGDRLRGAYWLNYLGPANVEALGGEGAIAAALSAQPVASRPLAGGVLALQIDGPPIAGDVNRREDLGAHVALAALFEPRLYEAEIAFPEFELEDTENWFRRFLFSEAP